MKHLLLALALAASGPAPATTLSPYAGEEANEIKALSPAEIDDLLQGNGMGFAKAAELNRYPGPRHVLDLAERLNLSSEQAEQTGRLFEAMRASAMALGAELVELERELDALFASGRAAAPEMDRLLLDIGATGARLRGVHLHAHLEMKKILSRHQVMLYDRLRGYSGGGADHRHDH